MEIFNLALLARQAWRLLTGELSLSARILKAVYFPEVSILEAELGSHPSQVWRSIIDGRDVLIQGTVKRIGDGESTYIWRHNWIPREGVRRPITSLTQNPPIMVSELIDSTTASWKEELIRATFARFDADDILKIPLCTRKVADFWAWQEEPKGNFSVRSCYRMILRTKLEREAWMSGEAGTSIVQQEADKWSTIWHMQVPSKLRMFVWRLARNSMPTIDLLKHRNMATEDKCPLCGAVDSWRHALFMCPMSSSVWALAPEELVHHLVDRVEEHPKDWLFAMSGVLNGDMFAHMIVIMWAIWRARRKAIYEDIFQSPQSTYGFITSFLDDLRYIKASEPRRTVVKAARPTQWQAPATGCVKINVDAAAPRQARFGAVGAICRSSDGLFLGASALIIEHIGDPETLEAMAIREGLALAEDLYQRRIHVASDCKKVVDSLKKEDASPYGAIVHEILSHSATFDMCRFSHEFRSSNYEAHNLAKHALSLGGGRRVWLGHPGDLSFVPVNIVTNQ